MFAYLRFLIIDFAYIYGRVIASRFLELAFLLLKSIPGFEQRSLEYLQKSMRYDPRRRNHALLLERKHDLALAKPTFRGEESARKAICGRSLVLKDPMYCGGVIEKGVLLIKFTKTFGEAFSLLDFGEIEKYFMIVLEPSWSGYSLNDVHCWMSLRFPIIIQSSEVRDFEYIRSLRSNLIPVTFGSSDWVDDRVFFPLGNCVEKIYDSIYIANFHPMKRHHVYLKTISKLKSQGYRAALVCGAWGKRKSDIEKMVRYFGLKDVVDQFEQLPQSSLNELLNKSRLNVLMSLKEGSNRTIFEGFFSNTPGLVLKNNIGVNKSYLNKKTGYLANENQLVEILHNDSLGNRPDFSPREWAMKHISAHVTMKKLNKLLASESDKLGLPWTRSAVAKVNSPEAQYYDPPEGRNIWTSSKILDLFEKGRVSAERIEADVGRRDH